MAKPPCGKEGGGAQNPRGKSLGVENREKEGEVVRRVWSGTWERNRGESWSRL